MDDAPLIESSSITQRALSVRPHAALRKAYLIDDFFIEYDDRVDLRVLPPQVALAPFFMSIAPIAWLAGGRWTVEVMDAALERSLEHARRSFARMYPRADWSGRVVPGRSADEAVTAREPGAAGVLFTGGLDSLCTSLRHRDRRQCLIALQGADIALRNDAGWAVRKADVAAFAERFGHTWATARSNFYEYYDHEVLDRAEPTLSSWWGSVQHALSLTGAAVPILYAAGCPQLLIGSSHEPTVDYHWGSTVEIDNHICCAGIALRHDAEAMDRLAKLRHLRDACASAGPLPPLSVCNARAHPGRNCEKCEKCLRSMCACLVEGVDARRFGFELEAEAILARVRRKFARRRVAMGPSEHYMWSGIVERARALGASDTAHPYPSALAWLAGLELDRYRQRWQRRQRRRGWRRALRWQLKRLTGRGRA